MNVNIIHYGSERGGCNPPNPPPPGSATGMQFKEQHNAWVMYMKSQANTHGTTNGCCINHTSDCLAGPCTCRQVGGGGGGGGGGCPNLMINPHLLYKLLLNEWLRVQIMVMHPICTCIAVYKIKWIHYGS